MPAGQGPGKTGATTHRGAPMGDGSTCPHLATAGASETTRRVVSALDGRDRVVDALAEDGELEIYGAPGGGGVEHLVDVDVGDVGRADGERADQTEAGLAQG